VKTSLNKEKPMTEIITILNGLSDVLNKTQRRQMAQIILALLCIPNRVTMLGLSRWTGKGGSYRTLHRWYASRINWTSVLVEIVKRYLVKAEGEYLFAVDDVVVEKVGKKTHGVGRFYSSLAACVIPSVAFRGITLVDVKQRRAYPVALEQQFSTVVKTSCVPKASTEKRPPGRPKGSKNHVKKAPILTVVQQQLHDKLKTLKEHFAGLAIRYVVMDGYFGNYPTAYLVQQAGFHLIAKIRSNAALYFPYAGPTKPGPKPRYGDPLNLKALPATAWRSTQVEDHAQTEIYQLHLWHKDFPTPLNVVVLVKTNSRTQRQACTLLFSTDLTLSAHQIVDYYALRFQIEFNFRDAKQFWGLDDFMNVTPNAVTNAAHLAFFMVNLSAILLQPYQRVEPEFSVLDLKAHYRATRYLDELINSLPVPPPPDLITRLWSKLVSFSAIRPPIPFTRVA
jgi:hypothetical protein